MGYYWPTVGGDATSFVVDAKHPKSAVTDPHSCIGTTQSIYSRPIYTYAFNLIYLINPTPRGHIWILSRIKC